MFAFELPHYLSWQPIETLTKALAHPVSTVGLARYRRPWLPLILVPRYWDQILLLKALVRHRIATFIHVASLGERVLDRVKPYTRSLFSRLDEVREEMSRLGSNQSGGVEVFHNGTRLRADAASDMRERLLEIAKLARSLDPQAHPGAGKLARVTTSRGYYALRSNACAFIKVLPDLAQEFIDREFPDDFIEDLQRQVDRFDAVTDLQRTGRTMRISGTAGLYAVSRRGMAILMELDAILSRLLKHSDPGLYGAWKAAAHVERQPQRRQARTEEEVPSGAAAMSEDAPAALAKAPLDDTRSTESQIAPVHSPPPLPGTSSTANTAPPD
jgi:hypothetical protein